MPLTYTLGILGTHPDNKKTVGYYESLLSYYWERTPRMNVVFFASTLRHLRFVASLLPACAGMPGLRAELVLANRKWSSPSASEAEQLVEGIGAHAELIDMSSHPLSDVYTYFVFRCDFIVFQHHFDSAETFDLFQRSAAGVPVPVQEFGYHYPRSFDENSPIPSHREDYMTPGRFAYDPFAELRQSVEYVTRHGLSVGTRRLPQVLLRKWLLDVPSDAEDFMTARSSWAEFMSIRDTAERNYLVAKLFYYVAAARDDFWMYGTPHPDRETLSRLFRQFRQLLESEAACRENGIDIPSFELFGTELYDYK